MPKYASMDTSTFTEGGGLYPGGRGNAIFRFVQWDYNGTLPPDSQTAVLMTFTPTDGSNEGKEHKQYYNIGNASDFIPGPEGKRLIINDNSAKQGIGKSSLWGGFVIKLHENCGLENGKLDGENGIAVLDGIDLTLAEQPQPKREGITEEKKPEPGKRAFPKTWLVPIKATFPWEKSGAKKGTTTTTAGAAKANTAAPVSAGSELTFVEAVNAALSANSGTIEFEALPKAVLTVIQNVPRDKRAPFLQQAKDRAAIEAMATDNGWMVDGDSLVG